jgi:hypothetical protein
MQTCLKCGYARQPTDDAAPAGVCPRCGVAYAKARLGTSRTFATLGKAPAPDPITDKLERGAGVAFVFVVSVVVAFFMLLGTARLVFVYADYWPAVLLVGLSSTAITLAVGLALRYLHGIYVNTLRR